MHFTLTVYEGQSLCLARYVINLLKSDVGNMHETMSVNNVFMLRTTWYFPCLHIVMDIYYYYYYYKAYVFFVFFNSL